MATIIVGPAAQRVRILASKMDVCRQESTPLDGKQSIENLE